MPSWRKNKTMALTNRGLETIITMQWLIATDSYMISRTERMQGAVPNQTYRKIFDEDEAIETFAELCTEAILQKFSFPTSNPERVFDLTDADKE